MTVRQTLRHRACWYNLRLGWSCGGASSTEHGRSSFVQRLSAFRRDGARDVQRGWSCGTGERRSTLPCYGHLCKRCVHGARLDGCVLSGDGIGHGDMFGGRWSGARLFSFRDRGADPSHAVACFVL
jgi:hypothetical protein